MWDYRLISVMVYSRSKSENAKKYGCTSIKIKIFQFKTYYLWVVILNDTVPGLIINCTGAHFMMKLQD